MGGCRTFTKKTHSVCWDSRRFHIDIPSRKKMLAVRVAPLEIATWTEARNWNPESHGKGRAWDSEDGGLQAVGQTGIHIYKKITAFRKINITKQTSLLTACTLAITENVAEQCETGEPLSSSCKSNTLTNLCNAPLKQRTELAGTSKTKLNLWSRDEHKLALCQDWTWKLVTRSRCCAMCGSELAIKIGHLL